MNLRHVRWSCRCRTWDYVGVFWKGTINRDVGPPRGIEAAFFWVFSIRTRQAQLLPVGAHFGATSHAGVYPLRRLVAPKCAPTVKASTQPGFTVGASAKPHFPVGARSRATSQAWVYSPRRLVAHRCAPTVKASAKPRSTVGARSRATSHAWVYSLRRFVAHRCDPTVEARATPRSTVGARSRATVTPRCIRLVGLSRPSALPQVVFALLWEVNSGERFCANRRVTHHC